MNPRRKFLLQGGVATTALFSAKPFNSMANSLAPLIGFNVNSNKIVLVHTYKQQLQISNHLAAIKRSTGNVVLLHAGEMNQWENTATNYDAAIGQPNNTKQFTQKDFSIVYKGNFKIGVITPVDNCYAVEHINQLSGFLKNIRNCDLVVCLSNLGYKNSSAIDDVRLAGKSSNLDIIIGGHAENFSKYPVTVFNKNQEEVIINHSLSGNQDFGKIEVEFDNKGNKHNVAFNNI